MSDEKSAKDNVPNDDEGIKKKDDEIIENKTTPTNEKEKPKELSTKEAYFEALNAWVKNANAAQSAMALFPWYMYSAYPQMFQPQLGFGMPISNAAGIVPPQMSTFSSQQIDPLLNGFSPAAGVNAAVAAVNNVNRPNINFLRIIDEQGQAEIINRHGGVEYVIAPFWKRVTAEMIDTIFLLLLKVVITFTVVNLFDWDWDFDSNNEALNQAIDQVDFSSFVSVTMDILVFSSNFIVLEIITKLIVCIYEAAWTTYNNGSTPGKAVMNIRILHCEALLLLPPPIPPQPQVPQLGFHTPRPKLRALIYPAQTPTLLRAILRAAAKSLITTVLFPMCFIMLFFKNNRTAYDIFTKTVVVESNPNANQAQRAN